MCVSVCVNVSVLTTIQYTHTHKGATEPQSPPDKCRYPDKQSVTETGVTHRSAGAREPTASLIQHIDRGSIGIATALSMQRAHPLVGIIVTPPIGCRGATLRCCG